MPARHCVITTGISAFPSPGQRPVVRDFRPSLQRLRAGLDSIGYKGDFIYWDDCYPKGCPPHALSPYAYKAFAISEAAAEGYELVLWLDATTRPLRSLDPLFHCIEEDGYLFFAAGHPVGAFCPEPLLSRLELTPEQSSTIPCCRGGAWGLDLRQGRSREFIARWKKMALDEAAHLDHGGKAATSSAPIDPRVKEHRADEVAASTLAWRMGMTRWKPLPSFFDFFVQTRPAAATLAPQVGLAGAKRTISRTGETAAPLNVLFFSRGRGRGHAVPDIAIAESLPRYSDNIDVHFVSYGTGAETFRRGGWPVIDLELPEDVGFWAVLRAAQDLIRELRPQLIVAHEEYAALAAAHLAGITSLLITDWFPLEASAAAEATSLANGTVFIGEPGTFPPPRLRYAPVYVGPVVRKMSYTQADRARARRELGITPDEFMIAVIPGAWATERRLPIGDLVLETFAQLPQASKSLFWLTKADEDMLRQKTAPIAGAHVVSDCDAVEQYIVASDVVITKGNRGTTFDAASLGIPTIALSSGLNRIDDKLLATVRSNRSFGAKDTRPADLCAYLDQLAALPIPRAEPLGLHLHGGERAAKALVDEITRIGVHRVSRLSREGNAPAHRANPNPVTNPAEESSAAILVPR